MYAGVGARVCRGGGSRGGHCRDQGRLRVEDLGRRVKSLLDMSSLRPCMDFLSYLRGNCRHFEAELVLKGLKRLVSYQKSCRWMWCRKRGGAAYRYFTFWAPGTTFWALDVTFFSRTLYWCNGFRKSIPPQNCQLVEQSFDDFVGELTFQKHLINALCEINAEPFNFIRTGYVKAAREQIREMSEPVHLEVLQVIPLPFTNYLETSSGTNWLNTWTYRVFIINTHRDWVGRLLKILSSSIFSINLYQMLFYND